MMTDYNKEFISREIAELFNGVEEFLTAKDTMIETIKYMYLHTSSNN